MNEHRYIFLYILIHIIIYIIICIKIYKKILNIIYIIILIFIYNIICYKNIENERIKLYKQGAVDEETVKVIKIYDLFFLLVIILIFIE